MPMYEYISNEPDNENCMGCVVESKINETHIWCPNASDEGRFCQMRKNYRSVQFKKSWPEHYNVAAGKVVRQESHLTEHYKAKSDELSERLNLPVNLVVTDPTDTKTLKVNEKGLDATHDANVKSGKKESKGKFVF